MSPVIVLAYFVFLHVDVTQLHSNVARLHSLVSMLLCVWLIILSVKSCGTEPSTEIKLAV